MAPLSKAPLLLMSLGTLLMVAGCKKDTANASLNTQYAARISAEQIFYDIRFSPNNRISTWQLKGHEAFMRQLGLRYGDRISIDDPEPSGAAERRAVVAGLLAKFGLIPENDAVVTKGFIPPNGIRLVIQRAKAQVNNCPSWADSNATRHGVDMMNNTGCATATNLAAMVADPNDLVEGRPYKGSTAQTIVKAVKAHHDTPASQSGPLNTSDTATKKN